jgi:hypothetical protein
MEAGFSNDCLECHDEIAWVPSFYDHGFFPLLGEHELLDCNACHSSGYAGTSNMCYDCHMDEYNNTSDPNHSAAGFPTDCTACHDEFGWTPSSFDHDGMYFPIYSGKHDEEWNQCVDCHFDPNDYSLFSCIDCHEHDNQAQVDDDHSGVSGYMYESNACYSCHPTGEN